MRLVAVVFLLSLILSRYSWACAPAVDAHSEAASPQRPRVLIIDDYEAITKSVEFMLEHEMDVTTASSGADGLALITPGAFDLVIVDFRMRNMDGVEVIIESRKIDPNLRFLLTSASVGQPTFENRRRLVSEVPVYQKCNGDLYDSIIAALGRKPDSD